MAILTLLAGILFTVFAGAKEKARQTHCMNNLKQLGAAILLYKQDYDGGWPKDLARIYPHYANSSAVFVCPDAVATAEEREAAHRRKGLFVSYERLGGSALGALSGEQLDRVLRTPQSSCLDKVVAYVTNDVASRLPVLWCVDHLLPGENCMRTGFRERVLENNVRGVMPTLEQDGSVIVVAVPTRYDPNPFAFNAMARMTGHEWQRLVDSWKKQLGCEDEQ